MIQLFRRKPPAERGAAAVEFALLVPILLFLVMAIVDFGMWYGDSITIRHGTREAARAGAVNDFQPGCPGVDRAAKTACVAEKRSDIVGGDMWVKVVAEDGDWTEGNSLTVCALVEVTGTTGVTPLPNDRLVRSRAVSRIEVTDPSSDYTDPDPLPTGATWAWCT